MAAGTVGLNVFTSFPYTIYFLFLVEMCSCIYFLLEKFCCFSINWTTSLLNLRLALLVLPVEIWKPELNFCSVMCSSLDLFGFFIQIVVPVRFWNSYFVRLSGNKISVAHCKNVDIPTSHVRNTIDMAVWASKYLISFLAASRCKTRGAKRPEICISKRPWLPRIWETANKTCLLTSRRIRTRKLNCATYFFLSALVKR